MTEFWIWFWGILLLTTLICYAALAVVVAVGGFIDIQAMFKNLDSQHKSDGDSPGRNEEES